MRKLKGPLNLTYKALYKQPAMHTKHTTPKVDSDAAAGGHYRHHVQM